MNILRPYRANSERRLAHRFPVEIVADVEAQQLKLSGKILDISREGLRLMIPDYLKPEVFFSLSFVSPNESTPLELTAQVVSCRLVPKEKQFMVGAVLTGASAGRTPELKKLLSELAAADHP